MEGLKNLPPLHHSHPQTNPPEVGGTDYRGFQGAPGLGLRQDMRPLEALGRPVKRPHGAEDPPEATGGQQVRALSEPGGAPPTTGAQT